MTKRIFALGFLLVALIVVWMAIENIPPKQAEGQGYYNYTVGVRTNLLLDTSIAKTVAFTTTGVRIAVYVPGTLSTDNVICTAQNDTGSSNVTAVGKTDSVIILRKAGGTSGSSVTFLRTRNF